MRISHYGKNRPWVTVFVALQVLFILGYRAEQASAAEPNAVESARELASSAYYQIDGNRFDHAQLEDAFAKLKQAAQLNPNEPYLYLSGSLASLVQGFGMGDWYEQSSFEKGTVERALPLAEKGVQLAPTLSQAHAQLARIYIMRKDFAKAGSEKHRKGQRTGTAEFLPLVL